MHNMLRSDRSALYSTFVIKLHNAYVTVTGALFGFVISYLTLPYLTVRLK